MQLLAPLEQDGDDGEQPAQDDDDPRANWDRDQMRRDQEARAAMMDAGFGAVGA